MPNILEMFSPKIMLDYLNAREYPVMLGEALFPARKIDDYELSYIKGANNKAVAASVHSFDAEAEIASRDGAKKVDLELAVIKRKIRLSEKEIIKLNKPRDNVELARAKERFYDDVDMMVMAVKTRLEAMRLEALFTGKLQIAENNVNLVLDYQVPDEHQDELLGDALWSETTSTPLADLERWVAILKDNVGGSFSRALTTTPIIAALCKHETIRKAIHGVNSDRVATKAQLNELLASMEMPQFDAYDESYRIQNANGSYTTKKFVKAGSIVILPDTLLGETIYAPTPEELELASRTDIDMSKVGNIVAMSYATIDPVAYWTKATTIGLPSFPAADEVFQAKVM